MLKVNESIIISMISNNDIEGINKYINSEIIKQSITDKSLKSRFKAFTSLSNKFHKSVDREALKGAWVDAEGYINLCDGYRIIQFKHDASLLPDLKLVPDDIEKMIIKDFFKPDYDYIDTTIDINDFNLQYKKYKALKKDDPLKKELSHYIITGAEDTKNITGDKYFKVYVNIEFLKDINDTMDLKNCTITAKTNVSPVIFINNDDRAMLLPIRVK